jgi:tripartite-type tricarboxylate transporter receptor subunit TctC
MDRFIKERLRHVLVTTAFVMASSLMLSAPAPAQGNYPARPVQMITPAAAGNGPDVVARVIADQLTRLWNEQVLVINRAGGSGLLAANAVAAAAPDGYTLYASNTSSVVVLPYTQKLPFDFETTFRPIGIFGESPMVIAVAPSLGVNSLGELIAMAKKNPGGINFAATTRESIPRYTMELVLMQAEASMTFVFYSGTSQALSDVIGGRLSVVADGYAALAGAIASGAIKPIAITSAKRLPEHRNVPTVAETLPGFTVNSWYPLLAPAKTPDGIVQKVSRDLRTLAARTEVQEKLGALGAYTRSMTPEELEAYMVTERAKWLPAVKKVAAMPDK